MIELESLDLKMRKIVDTEIKKIRICMNQICYIVTPVYLLSRYFDLEFYYITDGMSYYNDVNKIEFQKYRLIDNNIFYVTKDEFVNKVISDYEKYGASVLYYTTLIKNIFFDRVDASVISKISFDCAHGIDEEGYVLKKSWDESIKDYILYRAISSMSCIDKDNMIEKIYNIDHKKRTILFQDSINSSFFAKYESDSQKLIEYQNRMIDDLIKLKDRYNIIVRFHPQYYHGAITGYQSVCNRILDNFTVDYTQISLADLHQIADIVISSRYTSSGYQSLFLLNKNMIIIDMDLDTRKTCGFHKHWLVRDRSNDDIQRMMDNNEILNDRLVVIGREDSVDILKEVEKIEEDNYTIDNSIVQRRVGFIERNFGFNDKEMIDNYDKLYFVLYILEQLALKNEDCKQMYNAALKLIRDQKDLNLQKYQKFIEKSLLL